MKKRIFGLILLLSILMQMVVLAKPHITFEKQIKTDNIATAVCANDDFAFVQFTDTIQVYDISDSDNIKYYASIDVNPLNMTMDEKRLYIAHSAGCGYITFSDIKEGAANSLKTLSTSAGCNVSVNDKYLFISSMGNKSVAVHDMSRMRFPKVAVLDSEYVGLRIKKSIAYVEKDGVYHIYDLSAYSGEKSLESFKMGTVPVPPGASGIDFKGNYVFTVNRVYPSLDNRLYAYRINDDGTSTRIWEYNMLGQDGTRISDVLASGDFLYVAGQDTRTIYLFNIKNPENGADVLTSVGNHSGSYYGNMLALSGDKIIATDWAEGIGIYNVSGMLSGRAENLTLRLQPIRVEKEITTISGETVNAALLADNYTTKEISGKLIMAVYKGDKLVDLKRKDVTIAPCVMNQRVGLGNIKSETEAGYRIKAMLWEDNNPVMKNITVEYTEEKVRNKFYVDGQKGDDGYDGSKEAPFATIERARDAVRQVKRNMKEDITVYIKGGVYNTDGILFTAEDSGNNGYDVVYKAADRVSPVISGGEKITDWTLHDTDKNIYKASAKGIYTRQLYVNGTRAIRARSNGGLSGVSLSDDGMTCENTEIANYAHPEDLEFVFKGRWLLPRIKAVSAEITGGKCFIKMQQPYFADSKNDPVGTTRIKSPWYYENAYELLDSPGEFYIDPYEDTVYYIPRNGEEMSEIKAYLPKTEELIRLRGDNMHSPIHNIRFEGLTFANTAWNYPLEAGNCASQNNKASGYGVTSTAIYAMRAKNLTIKGCRFKNLGGGGIRMEYGFSDIDIIGNEFYDISAWAMDIGEYNCNPQDERLENGNVEIANNYIHDVAVEYMGAAAMSIGHLSDTVIRNNEIYNTPYTAIHIGWGWATAETSNIKNVVIRNNYIHEIMTTLRDGGAIYTNGGTGGTNENPNLIYQNYCKNQYAGTSVLYTDEGSCYWRVEQNVVDMEESSSVWNSVYGSTWTSSIHDIHYVQNFVTRDSKLNGGINCTYTDVKVKYSWSQWPDEAKVIMNAAGLEAEYQYLKD